MKEKQEANPSQNLAQHRQHVALRKAMGEVLTERRKEKGVDMKLIDIAAKTGLAVSTVSKTISASKTPIMFANLDAICRAVRLPLWELFLRTLTKMNERDSSQVEAVITLMQRNDSGKK